MILNKIREQQRAELEAALLNGTTYKGDWIAKLFSNKDSEPMLCSEILSSLGMERKEIQQFLNEKNSFC